MGVEKSKHLETHPLAGNLFENLIIADILKERLHNGQRNNLYFYRDSKGNEIDLCYEEGLLTNNILIEVQSEIEKNWS